MPNAGRTGSQLNSPLACVTKERSLVSLTDALSLSFSRALQCKPFSLLFQRRVVRAKFDMLQSEVQKNPNLSEDTNLLRILIRTFLFFFRPGVDKQRLVSRFVYSPIIDPLCAFPIIQSRKR